MRCWRTDLGDSITEIDKETNMSNNGKPHVLVLGGNFGGLTAARFIRERCGDGVEMTLIDRKPYLVFVPNIPIEVIENRDPAQTMHMPIVKFLDDDDIDFIQAEVNEIDVENQRVVYTPSVRPGAATERIEYDYLVIALGARLAYDKIEGFGAYGHTVSDTYYGRKLRRYLYGGGYKGGPIAIGSARFHQGSRGKPDWLPDSKSGCEGPPLEIAMALATWLGDRGLGGPQTITLFTPAEVIAEDAGEEIIQEFLGMAREMGFGYLNSTEDIKRVTAAGIEFESGDSLDAELKIILPDWVPHPLIKELPMADEVGFVVTDPTMRSTDYANIFAVGDCAAVTVPKLGAHGHQQAGIVAKQLAKDIGRMRAEEADEPFDPEIICMGEMGHHRAFYIHSNAWYGGDISVFKMGYLYYALKIAFKEMYFRTGGKPPSWGVPITELMAERHI
jgi:sulfide:quinone oxidoreductase